MNTSEQLQRLEKRIASIEVRNRRVELDKAWEGSWTRFLLILVSTYLILGSYMWAIGVTDFLLNAVIPSVGFTLSTLSWPVVKRWWVKR
ncbi:MAG TPA: hypothetical protein VD999_06945 [Vitreimonas sp.]|nr:hypothetical protein [Vitreimonas sp.]